MCVSVKVCVIVVFGRAFAGSHHGRHVACACARVRVCMHVSVHVCARVSARVQVRRACAE